MPTLALLSVVLEQSVQWKYGTAGSIGLLMLTAGMKYGRPTLCSVGAVILALLVAGPAFSS